MYNYILYIGDKKFCFESINCLKDFYTVIFDHCDNRRQLFYNIINENYQQLKKIYKEFPIENRKPKRSRIIKSIDVLFDIYGSIYGIKHNSKEIVK